MNSIIPTHNIGTDYDALVQSDRAHTSLYKDERIFDEEMEKIFYSTWVWVAHASEIRKVEAIKRLTSVNSLWLWCVTVKESPCTFKPLPSPCSNRM